MNREKTKEKAQKKLERVDRNTSNKMIIAALRFYVATLKPGEWVKPMPPRRDCSRELNRAWKARLWAARRLLGTAWRWNNKALECRLPHNFKRILFSRTGLNLEDCATGYEFDKLSPNFVLGDSLLSTFSDEHPYVSKQAIATLKKHYGLDKNRKPDYETLMESGAITRNGKPNPSAFMRDSTKANRKAPSAIQILTSQAKSFIARVAGE